MMQDESQMQKIMEMMNRHVPSKRTSLAELLKAKEAEYRGKDGVVYHIKRKELEFLASIVDAWDQPKLKLPIIIMTDTSYEAGGAWKIMGRIEVKVVSQIVGREPEFPDQMRLFHPHMVKLRTELPTATTTLFSP
jgi:uncharacterized protein (UPF0216 family)